MLVSAIITTKNEEKNIANCLNSILKQSYPADKIEVLIVDNNSTDKTKEIVDGFILANNSKNAANSASEDPAKRKLLSIKLFNKGPERSAQRNFGVAQSAGECFLYLDADMILTPGVIQECANKFKNDKANDKNSPLIGIYIPEIIMGESFWCKVRRFERSFYNATVIDCVRFIRKDKFLELGGFDESMSGPEDWDLDKKIRQAGKTGLVASPIYHNEAQFDLKKYLAKKGYYAKSFDTYENKWGKNDPDIRRQLGFYYRFIGVFIENGKWKKLIAHPVLTFGMYFLRFMVGVKYISRKNQTK